jgi:UDP-N-acetylmuramoylalanine--D-glutamate ligase
MVMNLGELALVGKHNVYRSMAAGIAARQVDIRNENVRQSMTNFEGERHRLEYVASVRGIEFINDSIATNINSVWFALENINRPIIWIAGGHAKSNGYSEIQELVIQKVKAIICLGMNNAKIIEAFAKYIPMIFESQSAEEAVNIAYKLGQKGDTVLLSPGCASFDLFKNYEDRGNQFKKAVINL